MKSFPGCRAAVLTPLLLCELESLSRHEAAKRLHIPEGTLSSRLACAKSLLRERLTRRGLGLPLAVLSTMLVTEAQSSMVPYALAEVTVPAAALLAAGCSLSGLVSAPVYSMFTEVLRAMMFAKIKGVAVGLISVGTAVAGFAVLGQVPSGAEDPFGRPIVQREERKDAFDPVQAKQYGHPIVPARPDSDRLHAVEQKLDRILEALGRNAPAPSTTPAGLPIRWSIDRQDQLATVPANPANMGERPADADRLTSVERRMADLERRMAGLEQRMSLQEHAPASSGAGRNQPSKEARLVPDRSRDYRVAETRQSALSSANIAARRR